MSMSLPFAHSDFAHGGQEERIAEKSRRERGRTGGWLGVLAELVRRFWLLVSRRRKLVAALVTVIALLFLFWSREYWIR